jgi:DNA repair exonuclease SbcCD ATPase subunit
MIVIKNLTLKNFLSIGQVTQAINFDKADLTLILGENLDLGGDGARNGTGKTTIIQGLSYALFGTAINQIKKDNLINRTNGKGMIASVEFTVNGDEYMIVRGRKPNILKFFVNSQEQQITDDSQGDSRETQEHIERILNMTPDMFRQIIALNTYNEPFLGMKVSDQRTIIEQLLGITLLSEKAEAIKVLNKETKDEIQREEFSIKGLETANQKIQEQIESLKKRQKLWLAKKSEDLQKLAEEYDDLSHIDIEKELQAHKDLTAYSANLEKLERYNALVARQKVWQDKRDKEIKELSYQLSSLSSVDIDLELQAHATLVAHNEAIRNKETQDTKIDALVKEIAKEQKNKTKLEAELISLRDHKCYACGQDFHDEQHNQVLEKKEAALQECTDHLQSIQQELKELQENSVIVPEKPKTFYKTEVEAIRHSSEVERIKQQIVDKESETDPYQDQINENIVSEIGKMPKTHYDTEEEAFKHSSKIQSLIDQIQKRDNDVDPYSEQIQEMQDHGIQTVDYNQMNNLARLLQHQDYLLDLLTNKKSFVRKKIIEQNLSYLNTRLSFYLDKMGLPHQVVFQNDLSVEITELGRELDFDNLSRGERNRLILGLSFAFRDVWESLYQPINILFVDELIDSGLDTIGVENSIALLKDMTRRRAKSIWLVSHREELTNRVSSILKVVKEGGFTSYSSSTETVE